MIDSGSLTAPRIIPAYAGLTVAARLAAAVSADHPRLRGVNRMLPGLNPYRWGSSPLTRG